MRCLIPTLGHRACSKIFHATNSGTGGIVTHSLRSKPTNVRAQGRGARLKFAKETRKQGTLMMHPMFALLGLAAGAGIAAIVLTALLMMLVLCAIPAILAFVVLSRVPVEHRKQTPGLAFLLLIPLFSLIWAFFVHPKVAESLQSYFAAKGDTSVGDCGAAIALWLCICAVCALVPLLGMFCGLASLILLIIFYVKAFDLSSRIPRTPATTQPA
jgi:hypothetical protein